jgi:hypothetical protein
MIGSNIVCKCAVHGYGSLKMGEFVGGLRMDCALELILQIFLSLSEIFE